MPRLIAAILARNEADRWLQQTLEPLVATCDKVLLLDDQSTDGTPDLARDLHCEVRVRSGTPMWGQEAPARAELWEWGAREAGDGWLLIADADMVLMGDPCPYTYSREVNAWSWILYDLWDTEHYRSDGYWKGHEVPRPWMFAPNHVPRGFVPGWSGRGIHCGHFPSNMPLVSGIATTLSWHHLQYSTPESRIAKHRAYLEHADKLTPFECAHAESILDAVT